VPLVPAVPLVVNVRTAGLRAVLVELDNLAEVQALYDEARRRQATGLLADGVEVVPAARTVLFDRLDDVDAFVAQLLTWSPQPSARRAGTSVELPVVYDGPDVAFVADQWGLRPDEVGDAHASLLHEVAFIGFSPGFAYLTGLPDAWRLPRLERPRPAVPAGAVGLADEFTGIYPRRSPGGWRLIGRCDVAMWDPGRVPPSLLAPGDVVRFVAVRR
jgi:KipI family sensor histidine kinase inhibitor